MDANFDMDECINQNSVSHAVPIWFVTSSTLSDILTASLSSFASQWAQAHDFKAEVGSFLIIPNSDGKLAAVLLGTGDMTSPNNAFIAGTLPDKLPAGDYVFANPQANTELAVMAWALGSYHFTRYKKRSSKNRRLNLPTQVDAKRLRRIVEGVFLTRDLINTPANDLGPAELEDAVRSLAKRHNATVTSIHGEALLEANFPLIYAVGAAAEEKRSPRLIDLTWGDATKPTVTLVGKGVCFDSGGLDIKPAGAMSLMKKDMGGAANLLGLAHMIMDAGLDVRLRVLIPAVENAISGAAFRPSDVYSSRKGLTVEIGNTDAEGRLILADALALADEEEPDLLIDMATLTGAARVALGPDLPPFFTHDDDFAEDIISCAKSTADPVWRMPLWQPYNDMMKSKIADINHIGPGSFGGAIIAALFLNHFVEKAKSWVHFDVYGWSPTSKPGQSEGGAAQAIRTLYLLLEQRFGR